MPNRQSPEADRVRNDLIQFFHASLDERVQRYLEIDHQRVTPNHHFAAASAECLRLYMDGHFMSTVMMTQAVAEGVRKFVVERNNLKLCDGMKAQEVVSKLQADGIITPECAEAFIRIHGSFRNDVHHMNPRVATIPFRELARKNIKRLACIEHEIFEVKTVTDAFVPIQPKYWDLREDGTTGVFLRCSP